MSTARIRFGQGRAAGVAWGMALAWAIGWMVVPLAAAGSIGIGTIEDLQKIGNETGFPLNGDYVLTNDIDASGTVAWNGGAGFEPIGDFKARFTGNFDGQGFVITGLHINRPNEIDVGLFSVIGSGCEVRNLGIEGGAVTGETWVGGLVGFVSGGTVSNAYATCTVTGDDRVGGLLGFLQSGAISESYATVAVSGFDSVGGLVGQIQSNGTVAKAYATGMVTGDKGVGGLVGRIFEGTVANSYAIGAASGSDSVGGLIGQLESGGTVANSYAVGEVSGDMDTGGLIGLVLAGGTVTASFWDIAVSGQATSDGGEGRATLEMVRRALFDDAGWDFGSVWTIDEGTSYPYLQTNPQDPPPAPFVIEIASIEDLQEIGNNLDFPLNGIYILPQDIDASDTANWNGGAGFEPIGDDPTPFTGILDGRGHVISGLHINRPGELRVGLFGFVDTGGEVMNVGLDGGSVTGNDLVGGLVGQNLGTVTQSYATGAVAGRNAVGGLVGAMASGTVTQSYATGTVSGDILVGGLVGEQFGGAVTQSYATGAVSGGSNVGGLVGKNFFGGAVTQCYATGTVSGGGNAGGLVGSIESNATVTQSYAAGAVSGGSNVGGLVGSSAGTVTDSFWDVDTSGIGAPGAGMGLSTIQMRQQTSFDPPWDFVDVWDIFEGESYPFLQTINTDVPGVPGDVNGDGRVNAVDVQLVINAALGIAIEPSYNADINGDFQVNAVDVQLVINAVLGIDISGQIHRILEFGFRAFAA